MSNDSSSMNRGAIARDNESWISPPTSAAADSETSKSRQFNVFWEVEALSLTVRAEDDQPNATLSASQFQRPNRALPEARIQEGKGGSARDWSEHEISRRIEDVVLGAADDTFEPGFQSLLETQLMPKFVVFGSRAVSVIGDLIKRRELSVEVRAECLRILGRTYYGSAKQEIFLVLIEALNSVEPIIRESAALALGDTEDDVAIEFLEDRCSFEKLTGLRRDFEQIIEDLRAAKAL